MLLRANVVQFFAKNAICALAYRGLRSPNPYQVFAPGPTGALDLAILDPS